MTDLAIIIRSCEERTTALCLALLRRQVGNAPVDVVSEQPFERALMATYRLGIEHGRKWTMTLDADVLLRPGAVKELVRASETFPGHYAQFESRVYDKLLGAYRQAGHRIYRTEFLPLVLARVPPEGSEIRPETAALRRTGEEGNPSRWLGHLVVGLHDFEQYYADLHRKALVHSRKHTSLVQDLIERCIVHLQDDPDFLVLLKGLWDGLTHAGNITIDKDQYADITKRALDELDLQEKEPIAGSREGLDRFNTLWNETLAKHIVPLFRGRDDHMPPKQGEMPGPPQAAAIIRRRGWIMKAQERLERKGLVKGSLAAAGVLLKRVGRYLENV